MMNDEREMIVCCAQILLDTPVNAEARETLELVANALCVLVVASEKERKFITNGHYNDIKSIARLLNYTGKDIERAKEWVRNMLSREGREQKGRTHFETHPEI